MCPAVLPLADYAWLSCQGVYVYDNSQEIYDGAFAWQIEEHGEVVDLDVDRHALTRGAHPDLPHARLSAELCSGLPRRQARLPTHLAGNADLDAVVFTSHPGSDDETSRPNYWAGNGVMPRAAQHENVLVCIYHLPSRDAFLFQPCCFTTEAFDGLWNAPRIFGRKGDGYVALFSQHPWHWVGAGDTPRTDLRVDAVDNVWLVEMGRKRTGEHGGDWDSFDAFIRAIAASPVSCDGLSVSYVSPRREDVSVSMAR